MNGNRLTLILTMVLYVMVVTIVLVYDKYIQVSLGYSRVVYLTVVLGLVSATLSVLGTGR